MTCEIERKGLVRRAQMLFRSGSVIEVVTGTYDLVGGTLWGGFLERRMADVTTGLMGQESVPGTYALRAVRTSGPVIVRIAIATLTARLLNGASKGPLQGSSSPCGA